MIPSYSETILNKVHLSSQVVKDKLEKLVDITVLAKLSESKLQAYLNDLENWFSFWPQQASDSYDPKTWDPSQFIPGCPKVETFFASLWNELMGYSSRPLIVIDGWQYDDDHVRFDNAENIHFKIDNEITFCITKDQFEDRSSQKVISMATFPPGSMLLWSTLPPGLVLGSTLISASDLHYIVEKTRAFFMPAYDGESFVIYTPPVHGMGPLLFPNKIAMKLNA